MSEPLSIHTRAELQAMAATLEASGDYRVMRKLKPRTTILPADGTPTRRCLFVDVETTDLNQHKTSIGGHEYLHVAISGQALCKRESKVMHSLDTRS